MNGVSRFHGSPPCLGRPMNGLEDPGIASAAADVAIQPLDDIAVGWRGLLRQEFERAHDHARRARAALESILNQESFLNGMKLLAIGQALDRLDRLSIDIANWRNAGMGALAIDQHGARAATAFAAAVLRSG